MYVIFSIIFNNYIRAINMKFTSLKLSNSFIIEPVIYEDERGFFFESYTANTFNNFADETINFVQDNHSLSRKNVLRGMHFQLEPFAQGKLVRVINGKILDVIIDLRKGSPSYLQSESIILSSENKKMLWVPRGFAHGFYVMSDLAEVTYKVDNYYNAKYERTIIYNDKILNNVFNNFELIVSEKDLNGIKFNEIEKEINFCWI